MLKNHKYRQKKGFASYQKGRYAEHLAKIYFMRDDYRIIATRARTPYGEIDLILRKKNTIVFVEVKARPTLEECAYAITSSQQKRLRTAATCLIDDHHLHDAEEFRFDALFFFANNWEGPHHIKNILQDY